MENAAKATSTRTSNGMTSKYRSTNRRGPKPIVGRDPPRLPPLRTSDAACLKATPSSHPAGTKEASRHGKPRRLAFVCAYDGGLDRGERGRIRPVGCNRAASSAGLPIALNQSNCEQRDERRNERHRRNKWLHGCGGLVTRLFDLTHVSSQRFEKCDAEIRRMHYFSFRSGGNEGTKSNGDRVAVLDVTKWRQLRFRPISPHQTRRIANDSTELATRTGLVVSRGHCGSFQFFTSSIPSQYASNTTLPSLFRLRTSASRWLQLVRQSGRTRTCVRQNSIDRRWRSNGSCRFGTFANGSSAVLSRRFFHLPRRR